MMSSLLCLKDVHTHIGQYHILQGINLEIVENEVNVLLGRNGAGKTTTLKTIMGLTPASKGSIHLRTAEITKKMTHDIANLGIGYVPEDQGIFGDLTVGENLRVAMRKENEHTLQKQDYILTLFPDLKKFWNKAGGKLSGGQKQMLAMARAFINDSQILLIDEPSKGLAPIVVEKVMEAVNEMKKTTTIVLVEQNFRFAAKVADRFYLMDHGRMTAEFSVAELPQRMEFLNRELGV